MLKIQEQTKQAKRKTTTTTKTTKNKHQKQEYEKQAGAELGQAQLKHCCEELTHLLSTPLAIHDTLAYSKFPQTTLLNYPPAIH